MSSSTDEMKVQDKISATTLCSTAGDERLAEDRVCRTAVSSTKNEKAHNRTCCIAGPSVVRDKVTGQDRTCRITAPSTTRDKVITWDGACGSAAHSVRNKGKAEWTDFNEAFASLLQCMAHVTRQCKFLSCSTIIRVCHCVKGTKWRKTIFDDTTCIHQPPKFLLNAMTRFIFKWHQVLMQ
ncbi:A-kinase-interacting protein 1 isoform X2 [Cetorhinus maximus]